MSSSQQPDGDPSPLSAREQKERAEDILRESEQRYRALVMATAALVWTGDASGTLHLEGRQWREFTGLPVNDYQGWGWINAIYPQDRQMVLTAWAEARTRRESTEVEFRLIHRSDTYRHVVARAVPIFDAQGYLREWIGTVTDIHERKIAEQALQKANNQLEQRVAERTVALRTTNELLRKQLRKLLETKAALHMSNEQFDRLFEFCPFPALILTVQQRRIARVNRPFLSISSYEEEDVVGRSLSTLQLIPGPIPLDEWVPFIAIFGGIQNLELTLRTRSGQQREMIASIKPIRKGSEENLLVMFNDVTERRSLERELQTISEQEHQRIGQTLHDELGQQLVGALFLLRSLHRTAQENDFPWPSEARELMQQLDGALDYTRNFARMLVGDDLKEGDLAYALNLLCKRTEEYSKISCHLETRGSLPSLPEIVTTNLYRIAQEAVTNAVKHAAPTHIRILLAEDNGQLMLQIRDDGAGISREALEYQPGIGMRTMQNRAHLIGATLSVEPAATDRGTVVTCKMASTGRIDKINTEGEE